MMKWTSVSMACAALAVSGCFKVNIVGMSEDGGPGSVQSGYTHTLINGLVPLGKVDAGELCGSAGVWAVDTKMSFVSLLASGVTFGLYAPMKVEVTCKK